MNNKQDKKELSHWLLVANYNLLTYEEAIYRYNRMLQGDGYEAHMINMMKQIYEQRQNTN